MCIRDSTYTVREVAGTDTNIDYDDMNAVVKVNVTKDAASGVLTAKVTMPEDTEFNNFAVAPVKTRFDFSKALEMCIRDRLLSRRSSCCRLLSRCRGCCRSSSCSGRCV